jgi:hypothetical protein
LNFVFFCVLRNIGAICVGIIQYVSSFINCSHLPMNASTCNECSDTMLYVLQNISVLSLNYYINSSSGVNCDLFTTATYLSWCFYRMKNNSNNTFYFRQLLSSNQSVTVAMTTVQTLTSREPVLITFQRR